MTQAKNRPRARGQRGQGRLPHAARQPAEAQSRRPAHPRQEGRDARSPTSTFSRKRIATRRASKSLESAIANAENNHDLDVDDLVVAEAFVGKALVMKRFHAARAAAARAGS